MKAYFVMFSRYNAWANGRLYAAAAALPDADFRADRGAFFKSLHGTLNHLLVTDRVWMRRFTGGGEAPDRLDAILFDAFAPCVRRAKPRIGALSPTLRRSMRASWPASSPIDESRPRMNLPNRSGRPWRIGSITKLTIEDRPMPSLLALWGVPPNSTCCIFNG